MPERDYELEARLLVKWCGWKSHGAWMEANNGEISHKYEAPALSVSLDACDGLIKAMREREYDITIVISDSSFVDIRTPIVDYRRRVHRTLIEEYSPSAIARALCLAADQIEKDGGK